MEVTASKVAGRYGDLPRMAVGRFLPGGVFL